MIASGPSCDEAGERRCAADAARVDAPAGATGIGFGRIGGARPGHNGAIGFGRVGAIHACRLGRGAARRVGTPDRDRMGRAYIVRATPPQAREAEARTARLAL